MFDLLFELIACKAFTSIYNLIRVKLELVYDTNNSKPSLYKTSLVWE